MQWIGIASTCIVVTALIGCLSVYILIQALRREEQIARTGKYALITGYQRFARLYVRNARYTFIAMIVGVVIVVEAPFISTVNFDALYTFYNGNILVPFGITLMIAGIAILMAITVYTVLRCLYVDAPALKLFRVSNLSKADVLSYTLRRELSVRIALVLIFIVLSVTGSENFFLLGLVLLIMYYIFVRIYRKRLIALYVDVDRQTIGYTGDPFALMVMLNSAGVLSPRQAGGATLGVVGLLIFGLAGRPQPTTGRGCDTPDTQPRSLYAAADASRSLVAHTGRVRHSNDAKWLCL